MLTIPQHSIQIVILVDKKGAGAYGLETELRLWSNTSMIVITKPSSLRPGSAVRSRPIAHPTGKCVKVVANRNV